MTAEAWARATSEEIPSTRSISLRSRASTSVLCAVHPDPQAIGGRYFSHCQELEMSDEARSPEVAARLWQRSEQWLSASSPDRP